MLLLLRRDNKMGKEKAMGLGGGQGLSRREAHWCASIDERVPLAVSLSEVANGASLPNRNSPEVIRVPGGQPPHLVLAADQVTNDLESVLAEPGVVGDLIDLKPSIGVNVTSQWRDSESRRSLAILKGVSSRAVQAGRRCVPQTWAEWTCVSSFQGRSFLLIAQRAPRT